MKTNATLVVKLASVSKEFPATWVGESIEEGADLADALYFSVRDAQLKAAFAAGEQATLSLSLNSDPSVSCLACFDPAQLAVAPQDSLEAAQEKAAAARLARPARPAKP
jgi:hypothetical protein